MEVYFSIRLPKRRTPTLAGRSLTGLDVFCADVGSVKEANAGSSRLNGTAQGRRSPDERPPLTRQAWLQDLAIALAALEGLDRLSPVQGAEH